MLSARSFSTVQFDPLTPLAQPAHLLIEALTHGGIAIGAGAVIARLMRRRHLHWSWAAGACGALVLARHALPGVDREALFVAGYATVSAHRRHRRDIESGGDLAELAARRHGPVKLVSKFARIATAGSRERFDAFSRVDAGELVIGVDESAKPVSIPFACGHDGAHALVVGATGSGKTVTQTWIALRAVERGMGAIVIDPKGDAGMREHLRLAAHARGRDFLEWAPDGGCVYNPYARGSAGEIADKALAGEHFSEPHYLRQAQRYLGHVVRALHDARIEVTLARLVEHMDPDRLELLARDLPAQSAGATFAYLDALTARQRAELSGVRDRLAILAESEVGRWLEPQTPEVACIDLREAAARRSVVYFSLESDRRPLLAQMLGAAIVQDLQTAVAALQSTPIPTLVVIDEFSAISTERVVRLFARARSAGFSLLLGTQELADLKPPAGERLLDQVLGNLSVLIAHRQVVPGSAELIASIAGRRGTWRVTRHSDGKATRTRDSVPVLDRDRIIRLGRGWAAVIVLDGKRGTKLARISFPRERHTRHERRAA